MTKEKKKKLIKRRIVRFLFLQLTTYMKRNSEGSGHHQMRPESLSALRTTHSKGQWLSIKVTRFDKDH